MPSRRNSQQRETWLDSQRAWEDDDMPKIMITSMAAVVADKADEDAGVVAG